MAMAKPMQAPTRGEEAESASLMKARNARPGILAICPTMSPMMSEQNRPQAMWLSALTTYLSNNLFSIVLVKMRIEKIKLTIKT
jgi:hypothetical protein